MAKEIVYKKKYLESRLVDTVRHYFNEINDSPYDSRGPQDNKQNALGWQGCWDRNLHLEKTDNPVHNIIIRLKEDFGQFEIFDCSIRYLCAPFLPHSDIRDVDWLRDAKAKNFKEGMIFLIPLWWHETCRPATVFYNCPAQLEEPLYAEMSEILPVFSQDNARDARNFSVRRIIHWESPGDLIAWRSFQWHGSGGLYQGTYDRRRWIKEFISIETWRT